MIGKTDGLASGAIDNAPLVADPAQLDEFYRRYFLPLVRRATWKHRLEKEDARDVVQEAFLVALVKLDPRRNPKAWLIQVVDHLSVNFQRKLARRANLVSKWSPAEAGIARGGSAQEEEFHGDGTDSNGGDY